MYRDNTNMGKAMYLADEFVPTGDEHVILYLVWGLKPTDTSDCHYTDYHCDGVKSYDESFDMNTPPTQRALLVSIDIVIFMQALIALSGTTIMP